MNDVGSPRVAVIKKQVSIHILSFYNRASKLIGKTPNKCDLELLEQEKDVTVMTKASKYCLFLVFSALFLLWALPLPAEDKSGGRPDIRPSVLAGTWYPGSKTSLEKSIKYYIRGSSETAHAGEEIKALIVPHAGYRYSGSVAASAFRLLEGISIKRVILIGPSHRMRFSGASVNLQSGYETPLGIVPVDRKFCEELMNADPDIGWVKEAHSREHCLEIQLPFLQMTLDDFKIVPILLSEIDVDACQRLAEKISDAIKEKGTLIIASTDLSHYHSSEKAEVLDRCFISHVRDMDPMGLIKDLSSGKCEACGHTAVITVLLAAAKLGADKAKILSYSHSGKTTGDNKRVVGYLSAALIKSYYKDQHRD
jgi:hypothetical protein